MKKKDVAPIISAMGVFTSFICGLVEAVKRLGGSIEAIYRLATPQGAETLETVARVIVDGCRKAENAFLKVISGAESLIVEALDGRATIAQAKKIFRSYIDQDFRNWNLDKTGLPSQEARLAVYEIAADATFAQMFGSLSDNLDKLVLSQSQIIQFCENYPNWLHQGEYGTFFLIKEDDKYFVVRVRVRDDGLEVSVSHLEYDNVWDAESRHRIVAPQL